MSSSPATPTPCRRVFLAAVPVALLAFALTWILPEVPLRRTTEVTDPADTLAPTAIPHTSSSRDEIARALSVLARRENREEIYRWLATEAALDLTGRLLVAAARRRPRGPHGGSVGRPPPCPGRGRRHASATSSAGRTS